MMPLRGCQVPAPTPVPPPINWMSGLMKPLVNAVTTVVKEAPITMPTARSTTLPRMMKSLKPWKTLFTSTLQHAEGDSVGPAAGAHHRSATNYADRVSRGKSVERRLLCGDRLVDRRVGA